MSRKTTEDLAGVADFRKISEGYCLKRNLCTCKYGERRCAQPGYVRYTFQRTKRSTLYTHCLCYWHYIVSGSEYELPRLGCKITFLNPGACRVC